MDPKIVIGHIQAQIGPSARESVVSLNGQDLKALDMTIHCDPQKDRTTATFEVLHDSGRVNLEGILVSDQQYAFLQELYGLAQLVKKHEWCVKEDDERGTDECSDAMGEIVNQLERIEQEYGEITREAM